MVIVNYGVGNLRSINRGLKKSGANAWITHNPEQIKKSDAIVLPGVGAFTPAVKNLVPITDVIVEAMNNGKPIFGELTFYPDSGTFDFTPDKYNYKLGDMFNLPV